MSPEDIDKLSIAEVRAIAERASEALSKLQAVQALLGGAAGVATATPSPSHAAAPPLMPPDMKAQREALLARNREVLPESIKAAEGLT